MFKPSCFGQKFYWFKYNFIAIIVNKTKREVKTIKKRWLLVVFLAIFTLTLSGCEFYYETGQAYTVEGHVTFEDTPLAGVKIQSDYMVYATTNEQGYYSFKTRASSLTIYAKKSGYRFQPKTVTVKNSNQQYNFVATQAELLNGTLRLNSILITPTSITSLPDNNYSYVQNGASHLKISEFVLKFNQEVEFHLVDAVLLEKNKPNNIATNPDFEFEIQNGVTNFNLQFQLKANFKYNLNQNESVSVEPFRNLSIGSVLDTGSLNESDQVKFIASGINSVHNGFTFDIQFVFNFVK